MSNKFLPVVIIVVLVLIVAGVMVFLRPVKVDNVMNAPAEPTLMMESETPQEGSEQMPPAEDESMQKDQQDGVMMEKEVADSRYMPYSESAFSASSDKRRVLFFYASWCPTCRPADAEFSEKVSQIPEDVQLIRVNYNDPDTDEDEKALAEKYGITYQHTYVQIDSLGKQVAKWNGGALNELLANIK